MQNVTLPNARGQAFALQNTFDDFGRGLGPVFVAMLISNLGGRTIAFNISVIGWILCGIFNWLLYFTVEKDEADVQSRFAESLHQPTGRSLNASGGALQQDPDDSDPLICTKRRHRPSLESQGSVV